MQRYKKGGWYGESYRHYLASKGVRTSRKGQEGSPMSLSTFLDEVKNPSVDDEDTNVDYFALVQQPNTSMRDTFYAEKGGFLSRPHAEREREALREQDVSSVRSDVVRRLDAAVKSGDLTGTDRKRFMEDEFSKRVREYEDGYFDGKDEFERAVYTDLKRTMKGSIFNWTG